ncbi:hypothetical protein J2T55_002266 [Methylohalomonas lacus]|uniref:Uncharacterized protein n=1 Tax=Methylohalomonas lacus TaxID=398773 RepID=A0AAE3HKW7_9GAMM|nr:hypothetical protein [Methylohalomonas lacus]MCS3904230.1 hypothetical protein [Methylohalomonas lacus]
MRAIVFITTIVMAGVVSPLLAEDMPMMVHSDTRQYTEDGRLNGCGLMITATGINGEYISTIIKLMRAGERDSELEYTVAAGNIDYTNGRESYDYVETAWLETETVSTRDEIADSGRAANNNAYRARYNRDNAQAFYADILEDPFKLTLITALHSTPYTHTFEQPFDTYVTRQAESCLRDYRQALSAGN